MCVLLKIKRKSRGTWLSRAANRWLLLDTEGKKYLKYCFENVAAIKDLSYSNISRDLSALIPNFDPQLKPNDENRFYTVKMRKNNNLFKASWSYEIRNIGINEGALRTTLHPGEIKREYNVEYPFKFLGQWQIWGKGQKRGSWKFEFKMLAVKKVIKSNRTGFQKALLQIKRKPDGIKGFLAGGACNRWIILDKEGSDFMRFCIEKELFVDEAASIRANTLLEDKLVAKDENAQAVCKKQHTDDEQKQAEADPTADAEKQTEAAPTCIFDGTKNWKKTTTIENEVGMEGLLNKGVQKSVPHFFKHQVGDNGIILLTGSNHYLLGGMAVRNGVLTRAVRGVVPNQARIPTDVTVSQVMDDVKLAIWHTVNVKVPGTNAKKNHYWIERRVWATLKVVNGKVTIDNYKDGKKEKKQIVLEKKYVHPIEERRERICYYLAKMCKNPLRTKIAIVREVKKYGSETVIVKPTWCAPLIVALNKIRSASSMRRRLAPTTQIKYVLDFGTGALKLVDENGVQPKKILLHV